MGCTSCGKKARPLGPSSQKNTSPPTKAKMKQPAPQPPMRGKTQSFTLQARDGSMTTYGSRLEAEAARVRAGGGNIRT